MKLIAIVFGVLLSTTAFAGDWMIGQWSHHFDVCDLKACPNLHEDPDSYYEEQDGKCDEGCYRVVGEYREAHPLIGYSNGKYAVIAMINSFDNPSVVVLRNFSYDLNPYIRPAASIGIGTGYDHMSGSVGPLTALGYFTLDLHPKHDRFGLVISYAPGIMVSVGPRFRW